MDGEVSVTTGTAGRPTAVGKAVLVVEALADHRSISDIGRATGLPTSTVHRILQELVDVGWVRADGERGYLPGVRLMSLAGGATSDAGIRHTVRPFLQDLRDTTSHSVHFALRQGDEAVYIDKLEGKRAYAMRSRVGLAIQLHCTAIGKAILAALPEAETRAVLSRRPMTAMTERTIVNPDALLTHLRSISRRGYALDNEENETHTRCIGAVVLDHRAVPIGGISMSALAFDLDRDQIRHCAPLVVSTARDVSRALGLPIPEPRHKPARAL